MKIVSREVIAFQAVLHDYSLVVVQHESDDLRRHWAVVFADGSKDMVGLAIGASRDQAVERAVAVLEAATDALQQPPASEVQ